MTPNGLVRSCRLEAVSTELEGYKEREPKQLQELEHLRADLELVKGELHRVQVGGWAIHVAVQLVP